MNTSVPLVKYDFEYKTFTCNIVQHTMVLLRLLTCTSSTSALSSTELVTCSQSVFVLVFKCSLILKLDSICSTVGKPHIHCYTYKLLESKKRAAW